jgi:hypothetical protein
MAKWIRGRSGNPRGRPRDAPAIAGRDRSQVERHQLMPEAPWVSQKAARGLLRYGAPGGQHDDTVMALAMAWSAVSSQRRVEYPMPDSVIVVKDFAIPEHWLRA